MTAPQQQYPAACYLIQKRPVWFNKPSHFMMQNQGFASMQSAKQPVGCRRLENSTTMRT